MIALCLITIDRFEMTKEVVSKVLKRAGYPYSLYVFDNGSKDDRLIQIPEMLGASWIYFSKKNVGVARAQNIMISESKEDYVCLIGNDIELPDNWLKTLVEYHKTVDNSGIAGIHTVEHKSDPIEVNGKKIHPGSVFGTMFFSKKLIENIGYICEDYSPYGLEDSDFVIRSEMAGYLNYYVHGLSGIHVGHDVGQDNNYRKMKDNSLNNNKEKFSKNIERYRTTKDIYVPLNSDIWDFSTMQF